MNNITKLVFIDHDGTLMDVPTPDTGRLLWKEKTGKEYPHKGWWGQLDSLNTNVFDIKPFEQIKNILERENSNPNSYTVLLTNRIPKFQPIIMNLLNSMGIYFDEYSFKNDNRNKKERILDILDKFPSLEEINIYDDQNDQIELLKSLKHEVDSTIKVEIYHVNNGQFYLVERYQTIEFLIKKSIKKYL